jgi:colanic acid/amylovoran biosynthesis glycosyltransferase
VHPSRDNGSEMSEASARIAVVLKGYPRLSETFVAQELLGLEQRGLTLDIYSLRHPYDPTTHPIHDEIAAAVTYLPEYLWRAPLRVLRGWRRARRRPGYKAAWQCFKRDLWRDRTSNRIRRFGQACVLAEALPPGTGMIYAHFLHTPASVARYAAMITGLPFAISAHAKDIWTTPDWEKREKIHDAAWLTTCTAYGAEHLRQITGADAGKVKLHYHGLDFARFVGADQPGGAGPTGTPLRIASVGRLVEKKGYDDLLDALAQLPPDIDWRLDHIGGGELEAAMATQADRLGLSSRISWLGRKPQSDVKALLATADLFVLASKIAADGDRDGLPNVLMEAQAVGVACISTAVSAIPELITDDVTGLLVPPGEPIALADAIARLAKDPDTRARLAAAGTARVRSEFDLNAGIDAIATALVPGDSAPTRTAA